MNVYRFSFIFIVLLVLSSCDKQSSSPVEMRTLTQKALIKNMTGIDPESIKDKSPEELNQMLDDLCDRFNISKDQLMQLASKFKK